MTSRVCYTDTGSGRIMWVWSQNLEKWIMQAFVAHVAR
jgi:hypothetical protein